MVKEIKQDGIKSDVKYFLETILPAMSPTEEFERFARYNYLRTQPKHQQDAEVKRELKELGDYLFRTNLGLVTTIAKEYAGNNEAKLVEYFSLGMQKLPRAIEKFELERGTKFSTYAANWIKHPIRRFIAQEKGTIHIPAYANALARKRDKGEKLNKKDRLTAYHAERASNLASYDSLFSHTSPGAEQVDSNLQIEDLFNRMGERLDQREMEILLLRTGMTIDKKEYTLKEIGKQMGITRERIRQLQESAYEKLQMDEDEWTSHLLDLEDDKRRRKEETRRKREEKRLAKRRVILEKSQEEQTKDPQEDSKNLERLVA